MPTESYESLVEDLRKLGKTELAETVRQCRHLIRLRLRNLPGFNFCWVIVKIKPESETQADWQTELPLDALPSALKRFRETKVFDELFKSKVQATVEALEVMRKSLGVTLTIEEAMR